MTLETQSAGPGVPSGSGKDFVVPSLVAVRTWPLPLLTSFSSSPLAEMEGPPGVSTPRERVGKVSGSPEPRARISASGPSAVCRTTAANPGAMSIRVPASRSLPETDAAGPACGAAA